MPLTECHLNVDIAALERQYAWLAAHSGTAEAAELCPLVKQIILSAHDAQWKEEEIARLQAEYGGRDDGEHPKYSRRTWDEEVSCGDTRLWDYWDWVIAQMEGDDDDEFDTED